MRKFGWLIAVVLTTGMAFAQAPASDLVTQARQTAAKSGKVPFIRFTASWCGWCHKMEDVLNSPGIKPIWDRYFVSTPIVVLENGAKEKLENPGGEALMESVGGKDQGIPFFYFVDPKTGKMIVNSMRPASGADKGGNLGCPYEPAEVDFFMTILKKASPKMAAADREAIRAAFAALKKSGK